MNTGTVQNITQDSYLNRFGLALQTADGLSLSNQEYNKKFTSKIHLLALLNKKRASMLTTKKDVGFQL